MCRIYCVYKVVLDFLRNDVCRQGNILNKHLDAFLDALVFVVECLPVIVYKLDKVILVFLRQGEHGLCLARDGVAHVASVPACQASLVVGDGLAYYAHEHLVSIAASGAYLES